MPFTISTTDGSQSRYLGVEYATGELAAEALREARGWAEVYLSDSYAVGDGHQSAVSAYETEAERDADASGSHAPRITETRHEEARS